MKFLSCVSMLALALHIYTFSPALAMMAEPEKTHHAPKALSSGIRQTEEGLYIGKIPGKDLSLVMERVDNRNLALWKNYIHTQSGGRAIALASRGLKGSGTTADGSYHFKAVLEEVSHKENEIWVAYITSAAVPQKIPSTIDLFRNSRVEVPIIDSSDKVES